MAPPKTMTLTAEDGAVGGRRARSAAGPADGRNPRESRACRGKRPETPAIGVLVFAATTALIYRSIARQSAKYATSVGELRRNPETRPVKPR